MALETRTNDRRQKRCALKATMNDMVSDKSKQHYVWPIKTFELRNHHFDSTIWNDFSFRDDDIVIATYAKCGTTWTQQIVGQLIFNGDPRLDVAEISPWLDLRVPEKSIKLRALDAQTHRRFLKSHLPVDALVFCPRVKYLYVARDGRDVVWSMHHHHRTANDQWYRALNDTPGLVGSKIEPPLLDIRSYFLEWLRNDGHPFWPFWQNVRSWWRVRHLPNVLLLHFQELKNDLPGSMRRIAQFLEIEINDNRWPYILEYCSFAHMKKNAERCVPLGGAFWDGGAATFINKGINGRWNDTLTRADCDEYETAAANELGKECADWLTGKRPALNGLQYALPMPRKDLQTERSHSRRVHVRSISRAC